MIHKNIYSKRIKGEYIDPYRYDIDDGLIFNSLMILFSKFDWNNFTQPVKDYCETKKIFISPYTEEFFKKGNYNKDKFLYDLAILLKSETENILDFFDIIIAVYEIKGKSLEENREKTDFIEVGKIETNQFFDIKQKFINELNQFFEHNNLGYEVLNDVIVTKDSDFLHQEVIVKSLTLLINEKFKGPVEEFNNAIKAYTKKDYENTIIEACKAFESTIKSILVSLNIDYSTDKSTAKFLLNKLKEHHLFDPFLDNMFNHLEGILSSGLPTIRNKKSGHGDGIEINEVERSYASFSLNLVGSSIVFLLDRYYEITADDRLNL